MSSSGAAAVDRLGQHVMDSLLEGCQVIPAVNRDLLVVVTDTPDDVAEEALQGALARLEFLEGLALVAGFGGTDPEPDPPQQAG